MIILLLLPLLAAATFCSSEAELLNMSFALCSADPPCRYNFNTDSVTYFNYLLTTELLLRNDLNWSVVCASEPLLWLALLRDHRFCSANQVLDAHGRCLCLPERNCNPKAPSDFDTSPLAKSALLVIVCAVVLYGFYKVMKEVRGGSGRKQ
jgi:hypothetical protein